MENIIQNPGLQHIVEKSLNCLDKKSIVQFRLVNEDCRRITDSPRLYLKKMSDENSLKDLIEEWDSLLKKNPSEDIKQHITMELFKMYAEGNAKEPLELAQDLAIGEKVEDIEFVTFIIGNSNPKSFVKAKIDMFNRRYTKRSGLLGIWIQGVFGATISAMHLAAYFGFEEAAKCVIANTSLPNVPNENGTTPIHIAAGIGNLEFIRLLMTTTGNPITEDKFRDTPIHVAAKKGHIEVVRLLWTSIDKTIIPTFWTGWTPIHYAARNGHLEVVRLLMTYTDNPNIPASPFSIDNELITPVFLASLYGHHDIVELLQNASQ